MVTICQYQVSNRQQIRNNNVEHIAADISTFEITHLLRQDSTHTVPTGTQYDLFTMLLFVMQAITQHDLSTVYVC